MLGSKYCFSMDNLRVDFRRAEEDQDDCLKLRFDANLIDFDDNDQFYEVGQVQGAILNLPEFSGTGIDQIFCLEVLNCECAYNALAPLYDENGTLDSRKWKTVGGTLRKNRVIYIEKVSVNPRFASRNLGACLLFSTLQLIHRVIGEKAPVLAMLGSFDKKRCGTVVQRYFEQNGFKSVDEDQVSFYLPLKTIAKHPGLEDVEAFHRQVKEKILTDTE